MGFLKPINRDDIRVGNRYWTCSWTGRVKVEVIEILKGAKVLVKTNGKNCSPFIREMDWIFDDEENCKRAGKRWENHERKRKKTSKENRKNKSNKKK